jgi:hypothetical protein
MEMIPTSVELNYDEIQSIKTLFPHNVTSSLKILQCLESNELQNTLPNLWTASRILQTIPEIVAACDHSFSTL